ncbi:MAG: FliG C-terminal domain-containing protein [Planctomycetaceae bacterium]
MNDKISEKAAMILGLLGKEMSDQILTRLEPSQAERVRARLNGSRRPTSRARDAVLEDFDRFLRFVQEHSGPNLKIQGGDDEHPGDSRRRQAAIAGTIHLDPDADPAEALEQVNEVQLAGALEPESARAAALLLGALPARRTAEVLAQMAIEQRDPVIAEMGREQLASPAVVDRLLRTVLQRALTIPQGQVEKIDRIQRLADVLRAVPKPQRREMMQTLQDHDPDTASAVNEKLYTFDDLEATGDRTVQKLLTEVDGTTLAAALSGASETIQEKIFNNLSRRARASLQEELEFQQNISSAEVSLARDEVVRALARVDMEAE